MVLGTIYFFEMMRIRYPKNAEQFVISNGTIVMHVFWICVLSVEAILYWRIRKRNTYRRASWAHVLILTLAFFFPVLENIFILFLSRVNVRELYKTRSYYNVQQGIYWALVVLAHVFFVLVILKCFKRPAPSFGEGNGVNILDDVEIYS